ncbi:hypothetical protein [Planobispora longispora]|uniref:Lipoprotein n=1 Tax=Planobispora longispora TaxID=28887 RepID=A0A8J3RYK9_9ACTN|nr:hypothetical protein [Planobispora longispora]GIH80503.1 hypothetical protein Plo01_69320 [Planobispora longispora]
MTPGPHSGPQGGPFRKPALTLLACALLVPTLTACTGAAGTGSATAPTPAPTGQDRQQLITALKDLAACFRQNGVPGAGDPVTEADGAVHLPGVPRPVPETARNACVSQIRRADSLRDAGEPRYTAAQIAQLRKLARCIREHGVPDWPDPDAQGRFPLNQRLAGLDKKAMRPALDGCEKYFVGGGIQVVRPSGQGGGDK